jgi:hypothetical protein
MPTAVQTTYPTNMVAGFAGQLGAGQHDIVPAFNKESSAELAFGQAVCFQGGSTDVGFSVLSPDALTDVIKGVVVHSHAYAVGSTLGTTGVKSGDVVSVLRKGRILVTCENGCAPGDRLHVRVLAGTEGALRSAADGINTIDSTTQGVWMTRASAGGLAELDVDFTNEA